MTCKDLVATAPFRFVIGIGVLGGSLVVLFYAEENWSGKRAWERCQQELVAQGAVVKWPGPVLPAVPDELNVLKAPGMAEWFVAPAPNNFTTLLNAGRAAASETVLELTFVPLTNGTASLPSDLCLDYYAPLLGPADTKRAERVSSTSSDQIDYVFPLLVMDKVPLQDAIQNLARQAGRRYLLDSSVASSLAHANASAPRSHFPWISDRLAPSLPGPPVCVNVRWQNLTGFQALMGVLMNYDLVWIEDPSSHIGRICQKSERSPLVQLAPAAHEQLKQALARCSCPPCQAARTVKAALGFVLYQPDNPFETRHSQPVRLTVRSAYIPTAMEVEAFFPRSILFWLPRSFGVHVSPWGTNTFRLIATPPFFCEAGDYLARTDSCKPEFDRIRLALKRPYSRWDGESQPSIVAPPRNFLALRLASQTLVQRAQSHLLLGQPDQALEELTLVHDLRAVTQAAPISVVSAMIEGAVAALYVNAIHDGLRLGAWREPQLGELQKQLQEINLGPLLAAGLSIERTARCHFIETSSPDEFGAAFISGSVPRTFWEKLKSPAFCILALGPRGWRYQSMAASASLEQKNIGCFDRFTQTVRPGVVDRANLEIEMLGSHASPRTTLAQISTPNFSRAWRSLARNQSLVHQAFIACALERFRLAHGEYPPDLSLLSPAFADRIPHDSIDIGGFHYRRLDSTHFKLYSVGWNGTDEGGLTPEHDFESTQPDWVWN